MFAPDCCGWHPTSLVDAWAKSWEKILLLSRCRQPGAGNVCLLPKLLWRQCSERPALTQSSPRLVLEQEGRLSPHNPTRMMCVPPQQQLCRDVSQGRWEYCLPCFPSHLLHRQDKQEKSCLILQDAEGGAGRQQTKTKRLMTQKKRGRAGS